MAVRTKRLFGPSVVAGVATLVYTCPAGVTALIKDLWFWPQVATVTAVDVFVNGTGANQHIAHVVCPNSGDVRLTRVFLVLHPGDTLRLMTAGAGSATCGGFGAELAGVAP